MDRCSQCLMVITRPDTQFIDGVCSACIAHEKRKEIDWEHREEVFFRILDHAHNRRYKRNAEYTCIVPSSGGKDSHAQVLKLISYGAHPLVVTATTCHLTPIGRRNIDNLARFADTIEITPNRSIRAVLNRMALELVGDISWPEHVLINTVPFKIAADMNIPLIFYGENPLNAYGAPSSERQAEDSMTQQWIQEFGGQNGIRASDFIGYQGIDREDMMPYMPMDQKDLAGIDAYFLGQFMSWDSHLNADLAIKNGFETGIPCSANWWSAENLDNAQTGLHDYMMWKKFGFGRACSQLSVDIRSGLISREDALQEMNLLEDQFPEVYSGVPVEDVFERIGLTRERFFEIMLDFSI